MADEAGGMNGNGCWAEGPGPDLLLDSPSRRAYDFLMSGVADMLEIPEVRARNDSPRRAAR